MDVVTVKCQIDVPFDSYENKKLDAKVVSAIKKWIKDHLNGIGHIPICITVKNGSLMGGTSGEVKVTMLDSFHLPEKE